MTISKTVAYSKQTETRQI